MHSTIRTYRVSRYNVIGTPVVVFDVAVETEQGQIHGDFATISHSDDGRRFGHLGSERNIPPEIDCLHGEDRYAALTELRAERSEIARRIIRIAFQDAPPDARWSALPGTLEAILEAIPSRDEASALNTTIELELDPSDLDSDRGTSAPKLSSLRV